MTQPPGSYEELSSAQVEMIVSQLKARGVYLPCPRCANPDFNIESSLVMHAAQGSMNGMILGGKVIPAAITVCARCGWMAEHALGALGLLNNEEFNRAGDR